MSSRVLKILFLVLLAGLIYADYEIKPGQSIGDVVRRASPGDTIYIHPGTYSEEVKVYKPVRQDEKPILIIAKDPNNKPVINASNFDYGFNFMGNRGNDSNRNIILDGIKIINAKKAGIGIHYVDYVTVRNCISGDNGVWGLFTANARFITVEFSEFYGSKKEHGIYFSNSNMNCIARNNKVHHNKGCGIHNNGDKNIIVRSGDQGTNKDCILENNIIYENGKGGGAAINMDGCSGYLVRNNLIYNNYAGGITSFIINGASSYNNKFTGNTVYFRPGEGRSCFLVDNSTSCVAEKNIFVSGRNVAVEYGNKTDLTSLDYNNNVLFNSGTDHNVCFMQKNADGIDFPDLEAKVPKFKNNIKEDPMFADPENGDFSVKKKSPAKGKGFDIRRCAPPKPPTVLDNIKIMGDKFIAGKTRARFMSVPSGELTMKIYSSDSDIDDEGLPVGTPVRTIVNKAGDLVWDLKDDSGNKVNADEYTLVLVNKKKNVRRMTLKVTAE